jgi:hypothetical protein
MRLAGRFLIVVASAGVPSVVALVACETTAHLPGLPDELNNHVSQGTPQATSSSAGSSGSSGSSSSSSGFVDAGPAQSLCDCAAAIVDGVPGCKTCSNMSCITAYTTCLQAPDCSPAISCVAGCFDGGVVQQDGGCIAGCLQQSPSYSTYVDCLDTMCGSQCGWAPPLVCPIDAGPG